MASKRQRSSLLWQFLCCISVVSGCATSHSNRMLDMSGAAVPRELDKITLPAYVVEPPDILLISTVSTLRSQESLLISGDRLRIHLKNGLPIDVGVDPTANQLQYDAESQIEVGFKVVSGTYRIGTDGKIDLGPAYGKIPVSNMTVSAAEAVIRKHLVDNVGLKSPELQVSLEDTESPQPVSGEHLVRPDGRVSLGIYGELFVAGMTLPEAGAAVKQHLESNGIHDPKVSVDVAAYNSKLYYVITDGGGYGESVTRLPYTGNETVLDAIAQIQGLPEVSSKRIWIARPAPAGSCSAQILEVAWEDIAALGQTDTNFQILPGDRVYIQADKLVAFDNYIEKIVAPFERIFGVSLLGFQVLRNSKGVYPIRSGGGGGGFG
ncbi:MAG: polysaccharide export protein [Schlesneria sp.]|nr:polysaccharide export protein [Schlesneria sp.]